VPARKNGSPSSAAVVIENGPAAAKLEPDTPAGAGSSSVPNSTEDLEPACTAPEVLEVAAKAPVEVETVVPAPSRPIRVGKASTKIEVVPGIHERALPDGRIAFLADETDGAGERLKSACDGLGRWNPRYRNWLTDPDQAAVVRETLLTNHQERSLVAAERSPATVNQQAWEA
jgi:hypothetical protein